MCGYRFVTQQTGNQPEVFRSDAAKGSPANPAQQERILNSYYQLWRPGVIRCEVQRQAILKAYRNAAKQFDVILGKCEF
jgi:hypothetical protein